MIAVDAAADWDISIFQWALVGGKEICVDPQERAQYS
jgi:hypothetical protein